MCSSDLVIFWPIKPSSKVLSDSFLPPHTANWLNHNLCKTCLRIKKHCSVSFYFSKQLQIEYYVLSWILIFTPFCALDT